MQNSRLWLLAVVTLALLCGPSSAEVLRFDPEGRDQPLCDPRGKPVAANDVSVRRAYGRSFRVTADGVDVCSVEYAWQLGYGGDHPVIQPKCQDLADYEAAKVEPGFLAIDPRLGRFKFSDGNKLPDGLHARFVKRLLMGNLDPWCIEVRDGFVYSAQEEETRGLQVVDARNPAKLRYAGTSPMSGFPFGMVLGESHAYMLAGGLLGVADISDPHEVKYIKSIPILGSMKARYADQKIFFAAGSRGVTVYDVSDGDDPELHEIVPIGKPFDLDTVDGRTLYLLEAGPAPPKGKPWTSSALRIVRRDDGGQWQAVGSLGGFARVGQHAGSSQAGTHRIRCVKGHVFFADGVGLRCVDVRDPSQPQLVGTYEPLKFMDEYYGLGTGALDICSDGRYLYVAAGHSRPKIRSNRDYPFFQRRKPENLPERQFVGGVYIFDLSEPASFKLAARLDDAELGMHTVTNVAVEGQTLYVASRIYGLVAYDISDLSKIRPLGSISLSGEVEYARVLGDHLYALGNGLYVCRAFPAEQAEILSFCWTDTWLFGDMLFGRVGSPYVWFHNLHGDGMRLLHVGNPLRPRVEEYSVPTFDWAACVGDRLYAVRSRHRSWAAHAERNGVPIQPAAKRDGEIQRGLVIYNVKNPRNPIPLSQLSTEAPLSRMEMRGRYVYALGTLAKGKKQAVYVFDVENPLEPRVVGKWVGDYADKGLMGSWRMYLYKDRLFLPMSKANGVRVLNVADPSRPRLESTLRYHDRTISVNSLMSANTFHVVGDYLYVADYWHGVHVFDIRRLKSPKWVATLKSPDDKFSAWSYGTSVSGYGRYVYKTAFGGVDIYEVSCGSDQPRGKVVGEILKEAKK